jgi:hypothetical protein
MAIVYQHRRLDTDEIFYIGIGNEKKRAYDKRRRDHWKFIVKKHGYSVEILYDNIEWEMACELEIKLIKEIGRKDLGLGPLINLTNGGEGTIGRIVSEKTREIARKNQTGKTFNEETRKKLSEMKKGVPKPETFKVKMYEIQKERGGFFGGKKHTEETKKKMSENLKGDKNPFFGKKHTNDTILSISGSNAKASKLTLEQVLWIRKNYIPKDSKFGINAISRTLKVSAQCICDVVNYKKWKYV